MDYTSLTLVKQEILSGGVLSTSSQFDALITQGNVKVGRTDHLIGLRVHKFEQRVKIHRDVQRRADLGQRARFAMQVRQLGTAHAVLAAETLLSGQSDLVVVISADMPLLSADTLRRMVEIQSANPGPTGPPSLAPAPPLATPNTHDGAPWFSGRQVRGARRGRRRRGAA